MMSLFSKLLRLDSTKEEDFHTEIVAHVLRNSPDLAFRWLKTIDATSLPAFDELFVSSQEELDPLASHQGVGSRPDIAIRISQGKQLEMIFVESKIKAPEMPGQLQKYAEHLAAQNASARSLIFITRDYEPKEPPSSKKVIKFVPQRWSDFYRFLKQQPIIDTMTSELLKFMEEHNMSQSNQFTAVDRLALTNFTKARTLMDHTMWESVATRFRQICGACSEMSAASTQLRKFKRYTIFSDHGGQMIVFLGYWIDDAAIGNSPSIGVRIHAYPTSAAKSAIIKAMRAFAAAHPGTWQTRDLSDDKAWSYIVGERPLQSFLADSTSDHVRAITEYFEQLLDDVCEFITANRELPWNSNVLTNQPVTASYTREALEESAAG